MTQPWRTITWTSSMIDADCVGASPGSLCSHAQFRATALRSDLCVTSRLLRLLFMVVISVSPTPSPRFLASIIDRWDYMIASQVVFHYNSHTWLLWWVSSLSLHCVSLRVASVFRDFGSVLWTLDHDMIWFLKLCCPIEILFNSGGKFHRNS